MNDNCVVGIYPTLSEAEAAVRSLSERGFPIEKVSILAANMTDHERVHGYITPGDVSRWSATAGAWAGGIFGLLLGAAFIWVPGFGPLIVAGPLSAALMGGVEGAVVGAAVTGALGWLVGLGISLEHVHKYEAAIKAGKFLVLVHAPSDEARLAHEILSTSNAEHLDVHGPTAAPPR